MIVQFRGPIVSRVGVLLACIACLSGCAESVQGHAAQEKGQGSLENGQASEENARSVMAQLPSPCRIISEDDFSSFLDGEVEHGVPHLPIMTNAAVASGCRWAIFDGQALGSGSLDFGVFEEMFEPFGQDATTISAEEAAQQEYEINDGDPVDIAGTDDAKVGPGFGGSVDITMRKGNIIIRLNARPVQEPLGAIEEDEDPKPVPKELSDAAVELARVVMNRLD